MSGFKVNFSVNNQLSTPSIHAAPFAQRPAAGQPGRVFIDSDNPSTGIYRDTGTIWVQIANPASEADTLQTVTDRGNTTTQDVAIGTSSTPSAPLDVHGAGVVAILQGTGTNDSFLQFNKSGSGKFKVGNVHNSGNDYFTVYNLQENSDAILVNISTNNVAIGGGTVTPTYKLDITGSLRNTGNAYIATSGGNVGIGTTTPSTQLDVNSSGSQNGIRITAGVFPELYFYRSTTPRGLVAVSGTAGGYYTGTLTNALVLQGSGGVQFVDGGGNLTMSVVSNSLLVGTTTSAGYKLDVNGTTRISGSELRLDNGTTGVINLYSATPSIQFFSGDPTAYRLYRSSTSMALSSGGAISLQIGGNNGYVLDATNAHIWRNPNSGGAALARLDTGGSLSIGNGTNAANAQSILDLVSTTKGFLPPRMTTAQKNAIANTAGLVVFDTTLAKLCVNSGAGWETITSV